jgi:hypothetical protein
MVHLKEDASFVEHRAFQMHTTAENVLCKKKMYVNVLLTLCQWFWFVALFKPDYANPKLIRFRLVLIPFFSILAERWMSENNQSREFTDRSVLR